MTAPAMLRRLDAGAIRDLCEVPEPMTVTSWATRYRHLDDGSPYSPDVLPYQRRWQDLMGDPAVSKVAMCWATQTGKSTCIENALGYRIHRMPSNIVVLRPKIDDAESWVKERFNPMVANSPVLKSRVKSGRSTDSTLRFKRFPGGSLFVASAQSATECASRSAPAVLCDEIDRMETIPGEGNPVGIVAKRMAASDIGLLVLTSTPRDAETSLIWPYLESGTNERLHLPCPHCDTRQELMFGGPEANYGLKWSNGKPQDAQYLCASCGCLIDEREKRGMLAQGEWVARTPEHPYPSSHLSSLYSPFAQSAWGVLADEWERAYGKPADTQVFTNTRMAEAFTDAGEQMDAAALADRLDDSLEEGVVPNGAGIVTAGVDCQQNRLEVSLWAWGPGLESWLVTALILPGDPGQLPDRAGSVWKDLDAVLFTPLRHASGRTVPIAAAFLDSGGHHTSNAYRYVNSHRSRRISACKGRGGQGLPIVSKPTLQTKARVPLYTVGVDTCKNEFLRSQLMESKPGPGYVHLGAWLTEDQREQLVAEKRVPRVAKNGKVVWEWRLKHADAPNEQLDCRNYARAALEALGARGVPRLKALADQLATHTEAVQAVEPEPAASAAGEGRANILPLLRAAQTRREGWLGNGKGFVGRW